jgi:methionine biosynthesis protein MetW
MPVRLDYRMIEEYVQPGAKVLDLGCGDGSLLAQLIAEKGVAGCGVDIDAAQVRRCISRGVAVYHGDMLEGMAMFEDGRFDCVVLSQTLQQTLEPYTVIREMLRVGRRAIISFPNFGHWRVRFQLLFGGRMPVTTALPYNWYETPNIRVLTVKDFFALCDELGLEIIDAIYLSARYRRLPGVLANWLAGMAIFVVESRKGA